jgi:DNA-binding NtrC family response regulator
LVATTNRDLMQMVREGKFREDLYYRLNVMPLVLPPLRRRPKDIESLARFFVEVSCHLNGKKPKSLTESAILKLKAWKWPGNVRELENVVERSVLMAANDEINDVEILIEGMSGEMSESMGNLEADPALQAGMTISEAERRLIMKTLEHTKQNRTRAAVLLGISIRTLRNKLHEYGQETDQQVG